MLCQSVSWSVSDKMDEYFMSSQCTPSQYCTVSSPDETESVLSQQEDDLLGNFRRELTRACSQGDREQEAQVYAKMAMQLLEREKYSEAVAYCKIQLSVCRTIANKVCT